MLMREMLFCFLCLILFGFFLSSCKKNSNNPITINPVGNIYLSSVPDSAQIWLDTTDTKKITPDSLTNLNVGNHLIILKLINYLDDTIMVNVKEGSHLSFNPILLSNNSVTSFGPIQIWDTTGSSSFPGGIILKTGRSSLISTGGKDSIDIYYSNNGFVITTPTININNRKTSFFVGLSTNLNDGVGSPTVLDSWVTQVQNSETNYFFLFDSDFHYSKMIITERDTSSSGSPAWIKVKWLYNNKPNDQRF
jgi:hypothetical protein